MWALAQESDFLDMAEASVNEFSRIHELFEATDYTNFQNKAQDRVQQGWELVSALQV